MVRRSLLFVLPVLTACAAPRPVAAPARVDVAVAPQPTPPPEPPASGHAASGERPLEALAGRPDPALDAYVAAWRRAAAKHSGITFRRTKLACACARRVW